MTDHEKACDEYCKKYPSKGKTGSYDTLMMYEVADHAFDAFNAGFHQGQEQMFRAVVELIRTVSNQEQDIFSKNDYVRYLLKHKTELMGGK